MLPTDLRLHCKMSTDANLLFSPIIQKVQILLFLALLVHLACEAEGTTSCCTRKPRPCGLYELLCRRGDSNGTVHGARFPGSAAAGILTLGKRKSGERRLQNRLEQLLHGSRNQAAGILTMGKRMENIEGEATFQEIHDTSTAGWKQLRIWTQPTKNEVVM